MNAKKATINETEKKLDHVLHNQEAIIKTLIVLEARLNAKGNLGVMNEEKYIEAQRAAAKLYIKEVVEKHSDGGGEIGTESIFGEFVYQTLKSAAMTYIGQALEELKKLGVKWAVELGAWLIERLQDLIINQYNAASEEQRKIFKEQINQHFPDSVLKDRLN